MPSKFKPHHYKEDFQKIVLQRNVNDDFRLIDDLADDTDEYIFVRFNEELKKQIKTFQ